MEELLIVTVLNLEQQKVLDSPIDVRQVVVAPPGCGKTLTAIELIKRLDGFLDAGADEQIVYISFSKAAIRAATEGHRESLNKTDAIIDIGTVDSFAFGVLAELERLETSTSNAPASEFFDQKIQEALVVLENGESSYFDTTRYVIVDEAQDLYGIRRQFVEAIIKALPEDSGVTIFGDPMQSIYQFLGGSGNGQRESESNDGSLIQGALQSGKYSQINLITNYRANSPQTKGIHTDLRELDKTTDQSAHRKVVDRVFASVPPISIRESVESSPGTVLLKRRFGQLKGTTAILTYRNAEVLYLAKIVTDLGFQAHPRFQSDQNIRIPSWVAVWNKRVNGQPFSLKSVMDFLVEEFPEAVDGALLTGLDFTEPFETTIHRDLAEAFLRSPDPARNPSDTGIMVSTIHQSKGLEFDNVFVVNYQSLLSENHAGDQTPLAYVALTRARSKVLNLNVEFPCMVKGKAHDQRRYVRSFRKRPDQIEIQPRDIELESGIFVSAEGERLMSTDVRISEVALEIINQHTPIPKYRVKFGNETLGITSRNFGEALKSATATVPGRWPELGPVLYDGAETALGNEPVHGRSSWLVPRPYGFSKIYLTK